MTFSSDVSIHWRHLRFLAIQNFKSLLNINPEFMWKVFIENPFHCYLQNEDIIYLPPADCEINSLPFCGFTIPLNLLSDVKKDDNLEEFNSKLRNFIKYLLCMCFG